MNLRNRKANGCIVAFIAGVALLTSDGVWGCTKLAQTELETVFCQIKNKDSQSGLPSLNEFRRNPPRTQYLLLKRPARKHGIALPEAKPAETMAPQSASSVATAAAPRSPKQPVDAPGGSPSAADCRLVEQRYVCDHGTYVLQKNRPNSNLASGAVVNTQLQLPSAKSISDTVARKEYLYRAYRAYIEAMLNIGLAEVTLSYTKFSHLYDNSRLNGLDFAERMQTMFEYLKNDKLTMAVRGKGDHFLPTDAEACQVLSQMIVVCDDVVNNWVYLKQSADPQQ